MSVLEVLAALVVVYVLSGIRVVMEYQRGVKFTLGKFTGLMNPGLRIVLPIIQTYQKIDMRVVTVDVPQQDCITKDNVSLSVDAVVYYKIVDPKKSVLEVENYQYAVSQLAQTTMRNVVGEANLDELLANRDKISDRIKNIIDKATDPWGIKVQNVDLKHVDLPDNMKRVMAREAEAEREKRGILIKAEGEVTAAENLKKAAEKLNKIKGGLYLRTLQTLNDISSDPSTKYIFVPVEFMESLSDGVKGKKNK